RIPAVLLVQTAWFAASYSPPHGDEMALHSCPTRRSSDLPDPTKATRAGEVGTVGVDTVGSDGWRVRVTKLAPGVVVREWRADRGDRQSTRLNSSHVKISYAVFC